MALILFSGLSISKVAIPNFRLIPGVNWLPIHIFSSVLGIVIIGIHIGMHWNWIKQIGSRMPKLNGIFTRNRSILSIVGKIILIVGTVLVLTQTPKMVSSATEVFSNTASAEHLEGVHTSLQHNLRDEKMHREGVRGEIFITIVQFASNIPNLLLYASGFTAMAFYTYYFENKFRRKRL